MPSLRDWLEALAFLLAFFTAMTVSDPAARLISLGSDRSER